MFAKDSEKLSRLDRTIDEAHAEIAGLSVETDDYEKAVSNLARLYTLREEITSRRVSPDTIAIVLGNLIGILVIVGYEQKHVVTSKALSFILKPR